MPSLGRGTNFAAISKLHADRGGSACRAESVRPPLLLDVVQDQGVERRRYGVVVGAVEPFIDAECLLQAGLGLLRPPGFTQQNCVVLQGKRGIGMIAAKRLPKNRECAQIEGLRLVKLPL